MRFYNKRIIASIVLLLGITGLHAEVKVLSVEPQQTDPTIRNVHSSHLAVYDSAATPRHRLFLFLPGTKAKATNSLVVARVLAEWGYHVVSLDYENDLVAVTFAHSFDPTAFTRYHNAIVAGAPVCDQVKVDTANSILNRVQKLLTYLAKQDPTGGWDQYVKAGQPDWNKIIVAGHSQGSGHAAYIGKLLETDRVCMFSGPQDFMVDLEKPAPWQEDKSATPPSHFFAFLSENDPANSKYQIANCAALMQLPKPATGPVKPGAPVPDGYQILMNDFPKERAHSSTVSTRFTNVWQYMLTEKPDAAVK